ncbi:WG repeat-containing protein [Algivirga pacifica]|uniref:WG containing repeat-containing protein n=1 Tax=Algivirga pacifica TaxID=1162670 RepID=A0ABP9DNZ9_9BACT
MKFLNVVKGIALIGSTLLHTSLQAQDMLVPLLSTEHQKVGYIHRTDSSSYIIAPSYEEATSFSEGLGRVRTSEGYFLLNKKGEKLNTTPYAFIGWSNMMKSSQLFFYEGKYIAIQTAEGLWGLIDKKGKVVLEPRYTSFEYFENGVSKVSVYNQNLQQELFGLIDPKGREKLATYFDFITPLIHRKNRYLAGHYGEDGTVRIRLFDGAGKEIIGSQYELIEELPNGLLRVRQEGIYALFNVNGKALTPFQYHDIFPDVKGYMRITQNGREGLLSPEGKEIYAPIYRKVALTDTTAIITPMHRITAVTASKEVLGQWDYDKLENIGKGVFLFDSHGKKGITTLHAEIKLFGQYEHIGPFIKNRSIVRKDGLYGVINQNGEIIIPVAHKKITQEQAEVFRVTDHNTDLYDHQGSNITQGRYPYIDQPSGKMYRVFDGQKYGFLNEELQEVIPLIYRDAEAFNGPYAVVRQGQYYGVINREGEWVISPFVDKLMSISEGTFLYKNNEQWGTLTASGIEVFRTDIMELQVKKGAVYSKYRGKFGLINEAGEACLPPVYDSISTVRADQTVFMYKNGKRYFKHLYEPGVPGPDAYDHLLWVGEQTEGYAPVKIHQRYGFVDFLGRLRISARYEAVQPYSEGLAPIRLGNKWGYLDKRDRIIIQPKYEEATPFEDSMAIVKNKGKYGVLHRSGKEILPCRYEHVERLPTGNWLIQENGKAGVFAKDGMQGIYGKYSQLKDLGNGFVITQSEGKYGLDYLRGLVIYFPQFDRIEYNAMDGTFLLYEKQEIQVYPL